MNDKRYARFITGLFCGILALSAAANALTPDKDFSPMENRALAQKPKLTADTLLSGSFMSDYETYVNDQFVLRDLWVAGKAYAERALGKKENNSVYFCAGDALITRFEEPNADRVSKNLDKINQFAAAVDVPVTLGLIPTQAKVWAHKLPANAPNYDQKLVLDYVARNAALPTADILSTLMEHKDEAIFYRTDHHWTSLGAYYGYVALADALGYEPVPLEQYEKTTVSKEFYGTVFSSSGVRWVKPDEMDTYVPEEGIRVSSVTCDADWNPVVVEERELYDESYLEKKDKYSMFLGGNQPLAVVETGNTGKPKLLIIRDSYTDSLVPFLTAHYSEIHLADLRYCKAPLSEYVSKAGIDQVLVLYSVPNFTSDANFPFLR